MYKQFIIMALGLIVAGCATTSGTSSDPAMLTVESDPPNARILYSVEEDGPWEAYRSKDGLHITPSTSMLHKNDFFWVKLSKPGYRDSVPQFVRASAGDVHLAIALEAQEASAVLRVDSDPQGAQILVAESKEGSYRPWTEADAEAITPARGTVPVGDSFWLKLRMDKFEDTLPEYVNVESNLPVHLIFDMAKRKRKATAAAKEKLTITSEPPSATILVSTEQYGSYVPWPPEAQLHETPLEVMVEAGTAFWVKLRKDGFETTEPRLVQVDKDKPVLIDAKLKAAKKRGETVADETSTKLTDPITANAIIANGYAIVKDQTWEAREAAILDALGNAIQAKYGESIRKTGVAENYELKRHRVESEAEGEYTSYDVLEDNLALGLYHIKLLVRFDEGILSRINGENVSFYVGGWENVGLDGRTFGSDSARSVVADELMKEGLRVVTEDANIKKTTVLAKKAQKAQTDVGVYLEVRSEEFDKFGEFYSYKTHVDYTLLMPVTGETIGSGYVSGVNEERQLNARDAAIHSLRDVGKAATKEMVGKLAARYERAAAYSVFVTGIQSQRDVERLVDEISNVAGVRDARLVASEGDICEIALIIALDTRPNMADAIQRLNNTDVEVDEADLYTAVAHVR